MRTRFTPDEVIEALSKEVKDITKMDGLERASALMGYPDDMAWLGELRPDGFEFASQSSEPTARGNRVPVRTIGKIRPVARGSDVAVRIRMRVMRLAIMCFLVMGLLGLVLSAAVGSGDFTALLGLAFPLGLWTVHQLGFQSEAKRAEALLRSALHERDPDEGGPYRMSGA